MGEPETSGCLAFDFTLTRLVPKKVINLNCFYKQNNNKHLINTTSSCAVFQQTNQRPKDVLHMQQQRLGILCNKRPCLTQSPLLYCNIDALQQRRSALH